MKRTLCLFFFLSLMLSSVYGALILQGDISSNTTLIQSNNPHQIRGYVRVMDGVTLTIEPGVTLMFENGSTLRVEGAISANGTYEQPIVFTSITGDDLFTRIELDGAEQSLFQSCTMGRSSDGTALLKIINSPNVTLNNLSVGTSTSNGIYISNSGVNMNSCNVSNVGGRGVYIEGSGSVVSLQQLSVNSCQGGIYVQPGAYATLTWSGIEISNSSSYPVVAGLFHYTGLGSISVTNTDPLLRMLAIWETSIWSNATLPCKSVPYLLLSNLSVGNSTLTLEPGVGMRLSQHGRITVGNNASLVADGTELLPITFYPAGNTTWKGITFETGSIGLLNHCSFNACGYPEYGPEPSIYANGMANLSISNTTIPGGTSDGILITGYNNGSLTLNNVQIVNCPGTGLNILDSTISLDYSNLSISGCGRAIALPANLIDFLDEQPNFSGNTVSSIVIQNDGTMRRNTSFRNWGYAYVSQNLQLTASYIALTIQPGCVFHLGNDVGFNCNGTVSALGTAEQPILFTRIPESSYHWRGFTLEGNISEALFDHCNLEHCALLDQYNSPQAAFRIYRADTVVISNTRIIDAECRGIFIESNNGSGDNPDDLSLNNLTISNCGWEGILQQDGSFQLSINSLGISDCSSYPLSISANWVHQLTGLTLTGNTQNLIRILGGGNFASQTLTNHGYPYLISGYNPYVYSSLNLEPGTVFYFEENRSLEIFGTITASGTASQPIIFDHVPGSAYFWQSLYLRNGCSASFEYCQFNNCGERNEYGYDNAFIENSGASLLSLQNCQISNVDAQAISCYDIGSGDTMTLNNVMIDGCRTDGIVCLDTDLTLSATNLTISHCLRDPLNIVPCFAGNFPGLVLNDNTNNNILFNGSASIGNVNFPNYGYVYRCNVNLYVNQGCTLSIAPGAVFWIGDGRYIDVGGGIAAQGTQAQPIVFTRYPSSTGYWQGMIFRNHSWSGLEHCQILWAGATDTYNDRRALLCQGASSLTLSDCLIQNSFGHGLVATEAASTDILTATNLSLVDIGWCAYVCDTPYHQMTVSGLNIQNTGDYPIYSNPNLLDRFSGVTITGAANPQIGVSGGYLSRDAVWPDFGLPLRMNYLYVQDWVTLTIPAGSTLIFPDYEIYHSDPHLTVYGALNVLGTELAPVTFRGLNPALPSTWNGVRIISPDGPCNLNYTNIMNAGLDENHSYPQEFCALYVYQGVVNLNGCHLSLGNHNLVKLEGTNTTSFTNCQLDNANNGIIQYSGTLDLINCTISALSGTGVGQYGGILNPGDSPSEWNRIYGNTLNLSNTTATSQSVPYVYWGSLDPDVIDATIHDDEEGGSLVNFEPWYDLNCQTLYYFSVDTPTGFSLTRQSDTGLRLNWEAVPAATSYTILVAEDPYATVWNVLQAGINATQLDLEVLPEQLLRFYKVIAVR